ncbi:MAG: hypothetical protein LBR55_00710 [Bacteroidales bacterium]|jgi:hypothetical protein|nr:hypothetical protein [Bacteroidales bacterium]
MTDLELETVATEMLVEMEKIFSGKWRLFEDTTQQFIEDNTKRVKLFLELHQDGKITQQKLVDLLEEEQETYKIQTLAIQVGNKALIQKAINMAMDILGKALKKYLK